MTWSCAQVADDKSVIHLTDLTIPMEIRTKKNVVPDQGECDRLYSNQFNKSAWRGRC